MDKDTQAPVAGQPNADAQANLAATREELLAAQAGQANETPESSEQVASDEGATAPEGQADEGSQGTQDPEEVKKAYDNLRKEFTRKSQELSEIKKSLTQQEQATEPEPIASPIADEDVDKYIEQKAATVAERKLKEYFDQQRKELEVDREIAELQSRPDGHAYIDKIVRFNQERIEAGKPQLSPLEAYRNLKFDELEKRATKQEAAQASATTTPTPKAPRKKMLGYADIVADKTIPLADVRAMLIEAQQGT